MLGFELVEDSQDFTNSGRVKRWVVVRPPDAASRVLLARAEGAEQTAIIVNRSQAESASFSASTISTRLITNDAAGVEFLGRPRSELYGRVVVFRDIAGNKWDLLES